MDFEKVTQAMPVPALDIIHPLLLVVVPSSLRSEVLYHLHNCAGHLGVKRTTDTVNLLAGVRN